MMLVLHETTDTQGRALEILRDHGPLTSAMFARRMWPEKNSAGAWILGGNYCGRLRSWGLVRRKYNRDWDVYVYVITDEGRAALKNGKWIEQRADNEVENVERESWRCYPGCDAVFPDSGALANHVRCCRMAPRPATTEPKTTTEVE